MKKETIFRYELNESIQADAAMNCLKNRNNKQVVSNQEQEEDYTNDEIPSPNFSYRMSFMVWAMREIIPYLKEISQVCAQADPTELKHAVMKILKTRDTGIPETPRSCQEWAKENYDWVEMELNGEYDAYQKKWSKPFNIPSEQEESADDKETFALKLVKKFKNRMTPDYAKRPEMFMMLKLQKALKKPLMSLSKEEYRAWAKAICDACESVFGSAQEQEEQEDYGMNDLRKWRDSLDLSNNDDDDADEETYTAYDDTDGIWIIINIMRKKGMLRAQGIEGRDDVDDGHAIDAAYDLIEQKLDDEGMWIGDDDHEAERFVSFFGEEIAAEAMKSAIHNQEQEEMPQMERHDIILALSEYMSESWIDTGDEGDLDDIYYAIADILDRTGDYPASTDWEDCKPWCQKHYKEVEAKIY